MTPPPVPGVAMAGDEAAHSPLLKLLRSVGFRITALSGLLLLGTALAMAGFLYVTTAGYLDRQTDAAIRVDLAGLSERFQDTGIEGLAQGIRQRLAEDVADEAVYALVDRLGRMLAGNLDRWPPSLAVDADWAEQPVTRSGRATVGRFHYETLPAEYRLLVGRDVAEKIRLRALITDTLVWAAGFALLLAVVGAWVVRRVLLGRMQPVSETAEAIAAGDLTRRVAVSAREDEFDAMAATLNGMLDRLTRAIDGVRDVSNAIAHDLRTPIARLRARLEDAALSARTEAELRGAIERGIAEIDGIIAIFHAILRIAEIEAGARRAAFAALDLAVLLDDAADIYGAAAEEKGLGFSTTVPASLPVVGDRDMLFQAVANLLDNAVKFSSHGVVRLAAAIAGSSVEISVSDDGPGIAPADRAQVTEKFWRGEQSRHLPGSGLGLTLVAAVAGLHGGALRLAENPGGGLRAVLSLPGAAALPATGLAHATA